MSASWLTADEFQQISGWSRATFFRRVQSGDILKRGEGRNVLYAASSLPTESRAKMTSGEQSPSLVTRKAESSLSVIAPLFAGLPQQRITLIDPADEKQANHRLQTIQPLLDYKSDPKKYHGFTLKDGRAVNSAETLAQWIDELTGTSSRTLWRWVRAYKQGGLPALADKRRSDKHRSRWAANNRELADVATYVHLEEKRSVMIAWEVVRDRANAIGADVPSYETVRAFLNNPHEVSLSMKTMALKGRRAYEAAFAPYIRRGFVDVASNEIWVSDHMIHDTLVQNDLFDGRGLEHMRLRMTTNLDFHSRFAVSFSWSQEGSSRSLTTSIRQGIQAHGLPYAFYCDNGKDYRKIAKGARPQELLEAEQRDAKYLVAEAKELEGGILKRLNIPVTYCIPFHPQSKHVEKYHRFVHERFDAAFDSYTAGAPHLRPDKTVAALEHHKKLLQMRKVEKIDSEDVKRSSALPLASEYIRLFLFWIEHDYHNRPHSGEGMDGRTPAQVFEQDRWKDVRAVPDATELTTMLYERTTRKVDSCAIELFGRRYTPDSNDIRTSALMHELTRQQVVVAYDPCDLDQVAILDQDGYLLCHLQAEVLLRQSSDDETRMQIANSMRQRRTLEKAVRESREDLARRVRRNGHKTQLESMRELAQLPAAVGEVVVHRPGKAEARQLEAPRTIAQAAKDFWRD